MLKSLPLKKLPRLNFQPDFSFTTNLSLKDFEVETIKRNFPQVRALLDLVLPSLPQKTFITVDYSELVLSRGQKTCKDSGWHVDGKGNEYLLVAFGNFRTCFLGKKEAVSNTGNLRQHNIDLQRLYSKEKGLEIEDGVPVLYDSSDIHRGQKADGDGKRVFLRLCSSDYLRPRNKVLEK